MWCVELEFDLIETDMRRVTLFDCKESKALGRRDTFTTFFPVVEKWTDNMDGYP